MHNAADALTLQRSRGKRYRFEAAFREMRRETETDIPGSADMRDMALRVLLLGGALWACPAVAMAADWSEEQIAKLPSGEVPVRLFNGKDTDGWEGHVGKYFFVENGEIVGRNSQENAPKSSTYLLTKKSYRNFRLIFESILVTSEMHSGISLWGKAIEKDSGPFTYQGHLVMYPSGYGYYDLFRRNSIFTDKLGLAKAAGKQHEWNRMEIVATGRRIRHVVNGRLVADWSDPQPELCGEGPIGLQLHSNTVPQEVRWRGLVLTENPKDALVTVTTRDADCSRTPIPPSRVSTRKPSKSSMRGCRRWWTKSKRRGLSRSSLGAVGSYTPARQAWRTWPEDGRSPRTACSRSPR